LVSYPSLKLAVMRQGHMKHFLHYDFNFLKTSSCKAPHELRVEDTTALLWSRLHFIVLLYIFFFVTQLEAWAA
jgi:hypothetical protein